MTAPLARFKLTPSDILQAKLDGRNVLEAMNRDFGTRFRRGELAAAERCRDLHGFLFGRMDASAIHELLSLIGEREERATDFGDDPALALEEFYKMEFPL